MTFQSHAYSGNHQKTNTVLSNCHLETGIVYPVKSFPMAANIKFSGSGGGSAGRAVGSDTTDPWFES